MQSLLVKLAMVAAAMAVVFWIRWRLPDQSKGSVEVAPVAAEQRLLARESAPPGPSGMDLTTPLPKPAAQDTVKQDARKLDLNRATLEELERLPGIGPVLAERIVEYRQTAGGFRRVEQLRLVKGIGAKKYERVRVLLEVTSTATPAGKDRNTT